MAGRDMELNCVGPTRPYFTETWWCSPTTGLLGVGRDRAEKREDHEGSFWTLSVIWWWRHQRIIRRSHKSPLACSGGLRAAGPPSVAEGDVRGSQTLLHSQY